MRLLLRYTLLLTLLAAAPASAQDGTGGAAAPEEPAEASQPSGGDPPPPDEGVVVVTNGAITLATRPDSMVGWTARFRGDVPESEAGRTLAIQRYDVRRRRWRTVARTPVQADGSFLARWPTRYAGRYRVRAVLRSARARAASRSPEIAVTVYERAMSTWYGPGFYGRRTACGQTMSRRLHGVAHKKLPCGTKVALMYRGRKITVPVVDRGPYVRGVRWDLTYATARALGFRYTDVVAAVPLRRPAHRSVP